jgi:hypothetical protein
MSYRVDRYNGTFLTSVADGTIDSTTDLRFVGRNYSGYGEVQNENFLHLLENFANTVAPSRPISGQVWYDSGTKKLKFYDGLKFKVASGAEVASTAPIGLAAGDLWFDSGTNQLSAWNGSSFVLIGPQSAPGFGTSQIVTQVVKDTNNTSHVILRAVVGGVTTAVFSNDPDFTLSTTNNISGFSETGRQIKKGITLNSVLATGVSDSSGYRFWGTASNSERLGGQSIDKFIRSDSEGGFTAEINFKAGLTINSGNRKDLRVWINTSQQPTIENQVNGPIVMRISNSGSQTDKDDMLIMTRDQFDNTDATSANAIFPGSTGRINLGASSRQWKTVFANTVVASLTGNVTGNVTGVHKGNVLAANNTVAYDSTTRTFTGDSFVGSFTGPIQGQSSSSITASKLNNLDPSELANPGVATIPIRTSAGIIRAAKFEGQASDSITVNGRSLSVTKDPNTIVLRNNGGDVEARYFNGTATSAQYADLAEIYKTDKEYEVGTVVAVGGDAEVTESILGDRAIGVISEHPAYLMNKDAEGQAVALKGRVPVKVSGRVKKGQRLVAGGRGRAVVATHHNMVDVFAIALEAHTEPTDGVIEAIII